jgi:hypothetical protein
MRRLSKTVAVLVIAAALSVFSASSSTLQPEQPATIRVGDVALVRVDSERHYSITAAGEALKLLRRVEEGTTTLYVFSGVAPGQATLVLTPRDPGPDNCISCVTLHYYITVLK